MNAITIPIPTPDNDDTSRITAVYTTSVLVNFQAEYMTLMRDLAAQTSLRITCRRVPVKNRAIKSARNYKWTWGRSALGVILAALCVCLVKFIISNAFGYGEKGSSINFACDALLERFSLD